MNPLLNTANESNRNIISKSLWNETPSEGYTKTTTTNDSFFKKLYPFFFQHRTPGYTYVETDPTRSTRVVNDSLHNPQQRGQAAGCGDNGEMPYNQLALQPYWGVLYSWLFSRALYFTNLLSSLAIIFTNFFAMDSICIILTKYFKVLYFTNFEILEI